MSEKCKHYYVKESEINDTFFRFSHSYQRKLVGAGRKVKLSNETIKTDTDEELSILHEYGHHQNKSFDKTL